MNAALYMHQARRWVLFAVIPALLFGLASYAYTNHKPKIYEACSVLYVEVATSGAGGAPGSPDIYNSTLLAPTYSQMATDPVIAAEVEKSMAGRYPGYSLGSVKASQAQDTQLVTVCVDDVLPGRAAAAANAVDNAFIDRVKQMEMSRFTADERSLEAQITRAQKNIARVSNEISKYHGKSAGLDSLKATLNAYQSTYQSLLTSMNDFRVTRDSSLNGVSIYSPATVPGAPIGPHPLKTAILFAFVVLLLGAGGIFLYDYFDDTLRTPEEAEQIAGAPILGTIQQIDTERLGSGLITVDDPESPPAEAYRLIRTNIQFLDIENPPRALLVTSPSPQEGKSTTASNLAQVMAESGLRVTLVDCDLRRPSVHRIFSLPARSEGLTNLLLSEEQLNGHAVQTVQQSNLKVVASGPLPPKPGDLLGTQRMRSLMEHMQDEADLVMLDSPPVLAVADAAVLSTMVDGVIVVVDPSKTMRRDLRRTREAIEAVGGTILGIIINRLSPHGSGHYYYYYRYHYGYQRETELTGGDYQGLLATLRSRLGHLWTQRPTPATSDTGPVTVEVAALPVAEKREPRAKPAEAGQERQNGGARGRGRPARVTAEQRAALELQLLSFPAATLAQHVEMWAESQGVRMSVATMDRTIARLGWTRRGGKWAPPGSDDLLEVTSAAGTEG